MDAAASHWLAELETEAADVVACWRVMDWGFDGLKAVRRELRSRVSDGDAPRILAQQEAVGNALERALRAIPERLGG